MTSILANALRVIGWKLVLLMLVAVGLWAVDQWRSAVSLDGQIAAAKTTLQTAEAVRRQALAAAQTTRQAVEKRRSAEQEHFRAEIAKLEAASSQWQKRLEEWNAAALTSRTAAERARQARLVANARHDEISWLEWKISWPSRSAAYWRWKKAETEAAALGEAAQLAAIAEATLKRTLGASPIEAVEQKRKELMASLEEIARIGGREIAGHDARAAKAGADVDAAKATLAKLTSLRDGNAARVALKLVQPYLWPAFLIMLGITFVPLAWKVVFYYLVAPWVSGHSSITLRAPSSRAPATRELPTSSSVSTEVEVWPGQELLIRPMFLQSSARDARKDTVPLLFPRAAFSSIASGMYLLTRLRPSGTTATRVRVADAEDALGEVAIIDVPTGEGLVLRPSSLAGVLHDENIAVPLEKHYRLFSVHAWCTGQLRFLEFRGPCRLIVKGARGVRIETPAADSARLINRSATLGFSSTLPFRVTRTETFVPYLLGHESLYNDLFEGERGVFIYEERPSGPEARGPWTELGGAFDAARGVLGV